MPGLTVKAEDRSRVQAVMPNRRAVSPARRTRVQTTQGGAIVTSGTAPSVSNSTTEARSGMPAREEDQAVQVRVPTSEAGQIEAISGPMGPEVPNKIISVSPADEVRNVVISDPITTAATNALVKSVLARERLIGAIMEIGPIPAGTKIPVVGLLADQVAEERNARSGHAAPNVPEDRHEIEATIMIGRKPMVSTRMGTVGRTTKSVVGQA